MDALFLQLRTRWPALDVHLFQGGACAGARRHWVPNCHRSDIPARWLGENRAGLLEKRSFARAIYPRVRSGKFTIVH